LFKQLEVGIPILYPVTLESHIAWCIHLPVGSDHITMPITPSCENILRSGQGSVPTHPAPHPLRSPIAMRCGILLDSQHACAPPSARMCRAAGKWTSRGQDPIPGNSVHHRLFSLSRIFQHQFRFVAKAAVDDSPCQRDCDRCY
jgi:hypothetical protein